MTRGGKKAGARMWYPLRKYVCTRPKASERTLLNTRIGRCGPHYSSKWVVPVGVPISDVRCGLRYYLTVEEAHLVQTVKCDEKHRRGFRCTVDSQW